MNTSSRLWPWVLVIGLFGLLAGLGLASDGVYQNDDLTHFVIARNAWRAPANFFDAWGRPGCTTPLALVAALGSPETGMVLARLLNAAMAAVVAGLTWATARRLGFVHPLESLGFLAMQPLFFLLGCCMLTEMPCALYLSAAVFLAVARRPGWSAFFLSLTFVTRHECVALGVVWLAWWLAEFRRGHLGRSGLIAACLAATWAPVTVNLAGWWITGRLPWAIYFDVQPTGGSYYGRGLITSMAALWLVAAGPLPAFLTPVGLVAGWGRRGWGLVSGVFVVYLTVHSACYGLNLFASGGYPRFLVTVAGPVALLGAAGFRVLWIELRARSRRTRPAWLLLALAATLVVVADLELARSHGTRWFGVYGWPPALWLTRGGLVLLAALFVVRRRMGVAGFTRFTIAGLIGLGLVLQAVTFGYRVRLPLGRTPHAAQLVRAAYWTASRYPGQPILASSDWVVLALDLERRVDRDYAWNELKRAPAGALYLCDVTPGDWRRTQGAWTPADYRASADFQEIPLPGLRDESIALFLKRDAP